MTYCSVVPNAWAPRPEPYCIDVTRDGYPLANFTVTDCPEYTSNALYAPVRWNQTFPNGDYAANYCEPLNYGPEARYIPQVLTCYRDFAGMSDGRYQIDILPPDNLRISFPFSIYTATSCPANTTSKSVVATTTSSNVYTTISTPSGRSSSSNPTSTTKSTGKPVNTFTTTNSSLSTKTTKKIITSTTTTKYATTSPASISLSSKTTIKKSTILSTMTTSCKGKHEKHEKHGKYAY